MSKFVYPPIYEVITSTWVAGKSDRFFDGHYEKKFNDKLPKDYTYVMVFTKVWDPHLKELKKQPNVKILHETPYAINTNHGGRENRQKMVVWEFTDEQVPPV